MRNVPGVSVNSYQFLSAGCNAIDGENLDNIFLKYDNESVILATLKI